MVELVARRISLTPAKIGEILTQAVQQKGGLRFKITKCGSYYTSPYFIQVINEPIEVRQEYGQIIIEAGDSERKKIVYLKPGTSTAEEKFSDWLSYVNVCLANGEKFEQPVDICFDRLGQ